MKNKKKKRKKLKEKKKKKWIKVIYLVVLLLNSRALTASHHLQSDWTPPYESKHQHCKWCSLSLTRQPCYLGWLSCKSTDAMTSRLNTSWFKSNRQYFLPSPHPSCCMFAKCLANRLSLRRVAIVQRQDDSSRIVNISYHPLIPLAAVFFLSVLRIDCL